MCSTAAGYENISLDVRATDDWTNFTNTPKNGGTDIIVIMVLAVALWALLAT